MAIMEHYFTTYILIQQNVTKHPVFMSKLEEVVGGKAELGKLIDANNLNMPFVWQEATEIAVNSQEKKVILYFRFELTNLFVGHFEVNCYALSSSSD